MTEVEVNGTAEVDFDISATKAALSSSSTSLRVANLQVLEERLSNNGRLFESFSQSCLSLCRLHADMVGGIRNQP